MSLLAVGRYKEPYTRLPTKLPNLNRLSVPATATKDVISSGGNPISYAPPALPARTINVFNELERKEPKQKRISDLMDLFLQVQKNKFIKEGVIQQAFKPEKHSNNMNYLASTNPDRAKEKMINAVEESLNLRTYNKPDGRLQLDTTEDIAIPAEELIKGDANINATELEKHLKEKDEEFKQREIPQRETEFKAQTPAQKRYIGDIAVANNFEQIEKITNDLRRSKMGGETKEKIREILNDRYNQLLKEGKLSFMAMKKEDEDTISYITGRELER